MDTTAEPGWHVIGSGIHEETTLPEHGTGLRVVHVVPYVIDTGPGRGHHGVVRLDPRDFTPHGVEEAIRAAVTTVHNVAGLGGHVA